MDTKLMMHKALTTIILSLFLSSLLAGCITAIDDKLPYEQLPEITVATQFNLVASPSHPMAYLSSDPIPAGEKVQVIGADQNAAWLLVLHDNLLGGMPTFYSRTNVATLKPALVVEPLSDKCTRYLGATFAPDEAWVSTTSGPAIVLGSVFRPGIKDQFAEAALEIEVTGAGQATKADYVHTPLTAASSLILFAFFITGLQQGSQIKFRLTNPSNESIVFEAIFFHDTCTQEPRFIERLPIGKTKVAVDKPAEPAQIEQKCSAIERPTDESPPITRRSGSLTSTPTPSATAAYYLRHEFSGKYVVSGDLENGGRLWLWSPIPEGHEARYEFWLVPAGGEYYYLRHEFSGKYVTSGENVNGGQFLLWAPIPSGHEPRYKFKLISVGCGYYYLLHEFSGKYMVSGDLENWGRLWLWGPIPEGHEARYKFELIATE